MFNKRVGLGSVVALIKSNNSIRSINSAANSSESLALEHINSGKPTTYLIINKVLLNQNLSVTESKLKELLKVKGVELDLLVSRSSGS